MNESQTTDIPVAFRKTLRWYHGFMMALPIATGLFIGVGYMIGAIGVIPAAVICLVLSVVALLQNKLFSEMAAMFPDKTGGVATFAAEAWKRYFSPIAPIAAFGYWCGWGLSLALTGITIGSLVQAQWLPDTTEAYFSVAGVGFGLPQAIGVATVVLCSALNVAGIKVALRVNQVIGAVFIAILAVLLIVPFASNDWTSANLTSHDNVDWKTYVVWLFVVAWAIYGTELCAVFAPEYVDTSRDTSRSLTTVALFMVGAYTIIPLATTGQLGADTIAANPITYGVVSVQSVSPALAEVVTAVLCGAIFLIMVSASADAGRALYGIANEGMSLKQLDHLSRRGVPSRAIWITMVINLVMIILVGNPVAILIASNLGYILAITLAVIGFLLLRKDRPGWPRPIRLGRAWIAVAAAVGAFDAFILVIGAFNPQLSHAGTMKEVLLGLLILSIGVVLFAYRKLVQDRKPIKFREIDESTEPPAKTAVGGGV
ncbi:APC family permease [Rhodococcus opacus]|uniref:APC family permease n=1 Tax=Rhodococcus opacus TaxID=37919 RepID=A0AAX3Y8N1_RHOOP|nr:APC family permease [Rhodococcus opacus]MCZ4589999.1 APC family permease [Rhodococcus opacus]WLF44524.1 APC family permease [Rhodococcus opacus]